MKKENETIYLHIISEDYKTKEQKQNEHCDVSGKTIQLTELQKKDASVIKQLRKMHRGFAATKEPMNLLDVSDLYASYQKIKTEEQELLVRKQDLLKMERYLRRRLLKEINKKTKTIETLHQEILALQNTCREISQEL